MRARQEARLPSVPRDCVPLPIPAPHPRAGFSWGGGMVLLIEIALFILFAAAWVYYVGDNDRRVEALQRIAFGLPFLLVMAVIGTLFGIYVVVTWVLDTMWVLVTGRRGFRPGGNASRLEHWRTSNTKWILTGEGNPRLFP